MAFTPVTSWVTGVAVTAAQMNARINALITELQTAVNGGGWQPITLIAGFTQENAAGQPVVARKVPGSIQLNGWVLCGAALTTTLVQVGTLDASIVPPRRQLGFCYGSTATPTAGSIVYLDIKTDRTIWAAAPTGSPTRIRLDLVSFPDS